MSSRRSLASCLLVPCLLAGATMVACQSGSTESAPGTGGRQNGGSSGNGGTSGGGGKVGTGGAASAGGAVGTGGSSGGQGGMVAGSGGTIGKGGATGSAGAMSSGGSAGKGGATAAGGAGRDGSAGSASGGALSGGGSGGTTGKGGAGSGGLGPLPDAGRDSGATGGTSGGGTGGGAGGGTGACTPPAAGSKGKNPLFTDVYTADPAALVHNCTFYINCGHDEGGGTGFVMNNWFILKSTDMVTWTRIDKALAISAFKWSDANAWAGQMVTKGGKFYWYVPINKIGSCPNNCGMAIGVAVGDSPEGPFKDALGKPLIDDVFEMSNMGFPKDSDTPYTIDPTVYVDDDGKAYMHYGSFGRVVHVNLGDDMISVSGKMKEINLGAISASDGKTSFFESAYLTKRNGKWYEIYAAGSNPAAINYSIADKPDGPWTAKGRIIDPLPTTSTDGATNHAGVAEFAGQWYIVYHVSNGPNGGGTYHREVAIDKLNFNADGTIQKLTPSSGLAF